MTIRQPRQQRLGGRQSLLCLKVSVFVCPVWFRSELESEALRDQKRRCRVSRNGSSVEADRRVKEASAASSGDALRSRKRDRRRPVASLRRRDWSDVESWPLCLLQFCVLVSVLLSLCALCLTHGTGSCNPVGPYSGPLVRGKGACARSLH